MYHNGNSIDNVKDLSKDDNLASGGVFIVGQKQGALGSGFDNSKLMVGYLTGLNIWSRVLTANEIKEKYQKGCKAYQEGDVVKWSGILGATLQGAVKKYCPSSC